MTATYPTRRRLLRALALAPLAAASAGGCSERERTACVEWQSPVNWPDWTSFLARHAQHDGRIIDFANDDLRSTSESQSYAMFLALVANDARMFEAAFAWMRQVLSGDRIDRVLPAWLWGRNAAGGWGVLDENNATDADLITAYALIEAARLWERPAYVDTARALLAQVRAECFVELPGFGLMLLPGRSSFVHAGHWRINPSYLPLPLLRRFHAVEPAAGWDRLAERTVAMLEGCTPAGFAPDWTEWNGQVFVPDRLHGVTGSYDAIRVYLWAGVTDPADPLAERCMACLGGPARMLRERGRLAEKINTATGVGQGDGPAGFAAGLLPYLAARGDDAAIRTQLALIPPTGSPEAEQLPYYERMLLLFGKGHFDGRYRFAADGQLVPAWSSACKTGR